MATIQGTDFTDGQVWDGFVGSQSPAEFIANGDGGPIADQCRTYAAWASTNMMDNSDDAPAWTIEDTEALAASLERYIENDQMERATADAC